MSQAIRSFLAFELPPPMREIISEVSGQLRTLPMNVRWVKPSNIHLTVVFMGDISLDTISTIGEEVRVVCSQYAPFEIAINGLGTFGSRKNPRVLWIGVQGDLERMSYFKRALEKRLATFGIKQEARKFNPHLTLGRFKKGGVGFEILEQVRERYRGLTSNPGLLNELVMFKSDLKPGGAVYTKISSWALVGKK